MMMIQIFASLHPMTTDAVAQLRERNQLTLPQRLAKALGAKTGDDLLLVLDEGPPTTVRIRVLPRSYAGIAGDLYGTAEERASFIAEERATWDDADPGHAPDGTPYLTFDEARRIYRQTDVTVERYAREPKLRWPKCTTCGRSIANMKEHVRRHASGLINDAGISTEPGQIERSRRRVRKWRASRGSRGDGRRPR